MTDEKYKGKCLKTLERRRDHLKKRIEIDEESNPALSYDKAELSALEFAIKELTA